MHNKKKQDYWDKRFSNKDYDKKRQYYGIIFNFVLHYTYSWKIIYFMWRKYGDSEVFSYDKIKKKLCICMYVVYLGNHVNGILQLYGSV